MKEFEARDHVGGFQMSASSTASSDTADKGGQQCDSFTLQDKINIIMSPGTSDWRDKIWES